VERIREMWVSNEAKMHQNSANWRKYFYGRHFAIMQSPNALRPQFRSQSVGFVSQKAPFTQPPASPALTTLTRASPKAAESARCHLATPWSQPARPTVVPFIGLTLLLSFLRLYPKLIYVSTPQVINTIPWAHLDPAAIIR